jgi:hypothetical protein
MGSMKKHLLSFLILAIAGPALISSCKKTELQDLKNKQSNYKNANIVGVPAKTGTAVPSTAQSGCPGSGNSTSANQPGS